MRGQSRLISLAAASFMLTSAVQGAGHPPAFADLDVDGDGQLSASELAALPSRGRLSPEERFSHLDSDGNGYIAPEEMHQARQRRRAHRPTFADLDSDGDGQLSIDEMGSLPPRGDSSVNERFARLDSDANGYISQEELRAGAHRRHQARHAEPDANP